MQILDLNKSLTIPFAEDLLVVPIGTFNCPTLFLGNIKGQYPSEYYDYRSYCKGLPHSNTFNGQLPQLPITKYYAKSHLLFLPLRKNMTPYINTKTLEVAAQQLYNHGVVNTGVTSIALSRSSFKEILKQASSQLKWKDVKSVIEKYFTRHSGNIVIQSYV